MCTFYMCIFFTSSSVYYYYLHTLILWDTAGMGKRLLIHCFTLQIHAKLKSWQSWRERIKQSLPESLRWESEGTQWFSCECSLEFNLWSIRNKSDCLLQCSERRQSQCTNVEGFTGTIFSPAFSKENKKIDGNDGKKKKCNHVQKTHIPSYQWEMWENHAVRWRLHVMKNMKKIWHLIVCRWFFVRAVVAEQQGCGSDALVFLCGVCTFSLYLCTFSRVTESPSHTRKHRVLWCDREWWCLFLCTIKA